MFEFLLLGLICLSPGVLSSRLPDSAPKVDLALYYESLCPYSHQFILQQLYPTFMKVRNIFNLTLVPYGNAVVSKEEDKWIFKCQHGPKECEVNLIETCAISLLENISMSFPFVYCFQKSIERSGDLKSVVENCTTKVGVDYAPIASCVSGSKGNELAHRMAMKTEALEPQQKYVPWVTINGKHTEKIQQEANNNLLKLVCDNYTGLKPAECEKPKLHPLLGKQKIRRCYKDWGPVA